MSADQHPDDVAIDRCAAAMKKRMAEFRKVGRGGWDDPNKMSVTELRYHFRQAYYKATQIWIDICVLSVMIWNRSQVKK